MGPWGTGAQEAWLASPSGSLGSAELAAAWAVAAESWRVGVEMRGVVDGQGVRWAVVDA